MTSSSNSLVRRLQQEEQTNSEFFWTREAGKVNWFKRWTRVLNWTPPTFRWFEDGVTNLSYNCLDRHIESGRGGQTALIANNERRERMIYTYDQLFSDVKLVAAALRGIGVKKGDCVAIYMPTIPEAIAAMLAATRIGAIHLVVFAGFGSKALAERMRMAGAKVLLTADVTWRKGKAVALWPIVQDVLTTEQGLAVEKVVVLNRNKSEIDLKRGRDLTWQEFLRQGRGQPFNCEPMEANEPAFILATSGTTATPKLTTHVHGGYQVWLMSTGDWLYSFKPTDVWWSTSDIGWIVGHSYIVYAPLLFGCASVVYEGLLDYPGPEVFYRIVEENRITGIFTAPTAVRLLMKYGADVSKTYDLTSLERVFCAGEVLNPSAWKWMQEEVFHNRIPVIDHMWQTETGGPIIGNPYGLGMLPIKPGSATLPLPGVSVQVRTLDGKECRTGEKGIVVITRPFPGLIPTIWGEPVRYATDYWKRIPGVYFTGDAGHLDEDGYLWFSGRADEIIKIAAHRIGTIEVESAILQHPAVAEAGVVGRPDELRGEVISAFVILRSGFRASPKLREEISTTVRKQLGAIAVIGELNFVSMLPKTRSGKIMRRVLKAIVLGRDPGDISTIEDESSVEEARNAWIQLKSELLRP